MSEPHVSEGRAGTAARGVGVLVFATMALLTSAGAAGSLPEPGGRLTERLSETAGDVLRSAGVGATETPADPAPVQAGEELKGLFRLDPAQCAGGPATGTYFRMIDPGGGMVQNADSSCSDQTYTPLTPGTDGGLSTADYQPHPDPAFDATGNGLNDRITKPQSFFGANFSTATNATDPQTGTAVPVPVITHDGAGKLSGNTSAFAAGYQRQHFNQGAPKPDGSTPGQTMAPAGTYDPATKRFTLDWSSTIVGGPFNNFTGQWHFEGVFEPAASAASDDPASAPEPGPDDSILPLPLPLGSPAVGPAERPAAAAPATVAGQAGGEELKGLFRILPASCGTRGSEAGSYFRMIQKNSTAENRTYVSNTSTTCADKTFTDLTPGTDGGISTVAYQPQPDPPFKMSASGLAEGANDKITLPKGFFGSNFATATNETDPQTNAKTVLFKVVNAGGKLSGDTRAFAAAYQGQHFNQGSPKPDGSRPGLTSDLTGTYDAATKKFTMEWTSTIVGGPFDGFTGLWHFEGSFEPAAVATPVAATGTGGAAAGSGAATTPAATSGSGNTAAPAGNRVAGQALAGTGPSFPAGVGAALLGLALLGRWAVRRSRPLPG